MIGARPSTCLRTTLSSRLDEAEEEGSRHCRPVRALATELDAAEDLPEETPRAGRVDEQDSAERGQPADDGHEEEDHTVVLLVIVVRGLEERDEPADQRTEHPERPRRPGRRRG